MFHAKMSPKQRMEAAVSGQKLDRIPCAPILGEYPAVLTVMNIREYLHSASLMAEAHVHSFHLLGYDAVGVGPDYLGLAEAMGSTLHYTADDRPFLKEPVLSRASFLTRIKPAEPERDGRLPVYLEALERIRDAVGNEVKVGSGTGGPFTVAACLAGPENLLKSLYRDPELVHFLLEVAAQSVINYMDACSKLGLSCSMGEPLASCDVISPRHFREFAKPYLKRVADRARELWGRGPSLHICGRTRPIWDDLLEIGISQFSIDEKEDLAEAKEVLGQAVTLKGNLSPVKVLLEGSPDIVRQRATECLNKAWDSPRGYVLSSGCTVPLATDPDNLRAMVQACCDFAVVTPL